MRLLIGKIGNHLVNGLLVIGERVFHILDYLDQRNRAVRFRQIHAGAAHDASCVRKTHCRKGDLCCPQLRDRVIGELGKEGAISRGRPEFAYGEQNTVGPGKLRRSGSRRGKDIEQFSTGRGLVPLPIR